MPDDSTNIVAVSAAFVAAVALSCVLLLSGSAMADTVVMAPTAAAQPRLDVLAAVHRGQLTGQQIRWSSRYRQVVPGDSAKQFFLPLAVVSTDPVPVVRMTPGMFEVRDDGGGLTGFRVARRTLIRSAVLEVELDQRLTSATGRVRLEPPVVRSQTPQLIVLTGSEGLGFLPDPGLGLVQRLGFSAPVDLRHRARRKLLRALDEPQQRPSGAALWVRPSSVEVVGGVYGDLSASSQRRASAGIWLGFGLVIGVALLTITLKGLDRPADVQEADQVLRKEFGIG